MATTRHLTFLFLSALVLAAACNIKQTPEKYRSKNGDRFPSVTVDVPPAKAFSNVLQALRPCYNGKKHTLNATMRAGSGAGGHDVSMPEYTTYTMQTEKKAGGEGTILVLLHTLAKGTVDSHLDGYAAVLDFKAASGGKTEIKISARNKEFADLMDEWAHARPTDCPLKNGKCDAIYCM